MLVTAVIATRNRSALLQRAIESVVNQTYRPIELIVVDDGSTDGTEEVVRRYRNRDQDVRYLWHEVPRGACTARNYGIREARGEFIAGLDDDDEWLPRRGEVLLENFSDEYSYVCARDLIVEKNERLVRKGKPIIRLEDMLYKNLTGNQILTRRERLLAVGGFDEALRSAQDYDLWLRLLERFGPAKMIQEVLQIVYRNHESERVSIARGKISGEWNLYKKHKSKMNRLQRRVHLLELKRLKQKKINLSELLLISNSRFFKLYARYYLRKALGRVG